MEHRCSIGLLGGIYRLKIWYFQENYKNWQIYRFLWSRTWWWFLSLFWWIINLWSLRGGYRNWWFFRELHRLWWWKIWKGFCLLYILLTTYHRSCTWVGFCLLCIFPRISRSNFLYIIYYINKYKIFVIFFFYPIRSPIWEFFSWATLWAMVMAATLLGWVTAMILPSLRDSSKMYWGI